MHIFSRFGSGPKAPKMQLAKILKFVITLYTVLQTVYAKNRLRVYQNPSPTLNANATNRLTCQCSLLLIMTH